MEEEATFEPCHMDFLVYTFYGYPSFPDFPREKKKSKVTAPLLHSDSDVKRGIGLWLFMTYRNLCGCRMDLLRSLVFWLAWIAQRPSQPTELCPMLVGDQGTGKTQWVDHITKLVYGQRNCEVHNNVQVFESRFSGSQGAVFTCLEEMTSKNSELLKSRITPPIGGVMQERKHKDACVVSSFSNFIVGSNGGWTLEQNARRFLVIPNNPKAAHAITCSGDPLYSTFAQQFADLDEFYHTNGHMLGVWLCSLDLASFPVAHPKKLALHVTSHTQAWMRYQAMSPTVQWYTRQLIRRSNCNSSVDCEFPHDLLWHPGTTFHVPMTVNGVTTQRLVSEYTSVKYRNYHTLHKDGLKHLELDDLRPYVTLHEKHLEFGPYETAVENFLLREECFRLRLDGGISVIRNVLEAPQYECPPVVAAITALGHPTSYEEFVDFFTLLH